MTDNPRAAVTSGGRPGRAAGTAGPVIFAVAGVLFALYPAIRPYSDESTMSGAVAFSSAAWVASHMFAMIGFVLLPLGLLSLLGVLDAAGAQRAGRAALVMAWVGAGLVLPYYGAETFALHALGTRASQVGDPALLGLADAIRYGPTQAVMFGAGLLLLAAGGVLAAVAIWRSDTLPRVSAVPLALGLVLFLPQFFTTPSVRIAHGLLVAAGCAVLAVGLGRRSTAAADRRFS